MLFRSLNVRTDASRDSFQRSDRGSDRDRGGDRMNFTKLFINAGKKQNLNASGLIGLINQYSNRRNVEIGKIDIQRKFSFFEIDSSFEKDLVNAMNNEVIEGHVINIGKVESTAETQPRERSSFRREGGNNGGGGYAGGRREGRREPAFSDRGDRGGDRGDRPRRRRN